MSSSRPDQAREDYFRAKYGEMASAAEYRWFAAGWDAAIDATIKQHTRDNEKEPAV